MRRNILPFSFLVAAVSTAVAGLFVSCGSNPEKGRVGVGAWQEFAQKVSSEEYRASSNEAYKFDMEKRQLLLRTYRTGQLELKYDSFYVDGDIGKKWFLDPRNFGYSVTFAKRDMALWKGSPNWQPRDLSGSPSLFNIQCVLEKSYELTNVTHTPLAPYEDWAGKYQSAIPHNYAKLAQYFVETRFNEYRLEGRIVGRSGLLEDLDEATIQEKYQPVARYLCERNFTSDGQRSLEEQFSSSYYHQSSFGFQKVTGDHLIEIPAHVYPSEEQKLATKWKRIFVTENAFDSFNLFKADLVGHYSRIYNRSGGVIVPKKPRLTMEIDGQGKLHLIGKKERTDDEDGYFPSCDFKLKLPITKFVAAQKGATTSGFMLYMDSDAIELDVSNGGTDDSSSGSSSPHCRIHSFVEHLKQGDLILFLNESTAGSGQAEMRTIDLELAQYSPEVQQVFSWWGSTVSFDWKFVRNKK